MPVPVPHIKDMVIIMPLVRASGTGKASSHEKAKETLVIGIKDIPIRSIDVLSRTTLFEGRVPKCIRVLIKLSPQMI